MIRFDKGPSTPQGGRRPLMIEMGGVKHSVTTWAILLGMTPDGLRKRLRSGLPLRVALTAPPEHHDVR